MKLQVYVLREILVNFLFTAIVLSFIAFLATAVLATYRIPGASPFTVLGYVPILIMYIFPYLLPMSLLVGVVMTYGRLSAENEVTAVRACGIHYWSLTVPSLLLGLIVAAVTTPLVHEWIPKFYFQKTEYLRNATTDLIVNLSPSVRSIHTSSFHLEWARKNGAFFEDLYLFLKRGGGDEVRVQADRGMIHPEGEDLIVTLWGSHSLVESKKGQESNDVSSTRITYRIPFDELSGSARFIPSKDSECTSTELATKLRRGKSAEPLRTSYEIQKRCANVFSGLLFAAVGVPIGILMRRGTRLAAFATAFLTVLGGYYPVVYGMEMLGKDQAIHPWIAAWTANALLGIVVIILMRKLFKT